MYGFLFIILFSIWAPAVQIAGAQIRLTKDQALEQAFPRGSQIERKTLFLTADEGKRIEERAKSKVESKIVTYYIGRTDSGISGYAFFETHTVRTMPATYMVVLDANGSIIKVEILAFFEPDDYLPPRKWLDQFQGKQLDDRMWVKRGIRNISGATLSAQELVSGTRRILATFSVAIKKDS